MPMNPMDPKFLRTHIRRPRNIKRRFSAALTPWCAWRKRGFAAGALALAPPARSLPAARVSRPLPTSLAPPRPSSAHARHAYGHIVRKEKAARFSGFRAENEPFAKLEEVGQVRRRPQRRTPSHSTWLVYPNTSNEPRGLATKEAGRQAARATSG